MLRREEPIRSRRPRGVAEALWGLAALRLGILGLVACKSGAKPNAAPVAAGDGASVAVWDAAPVATASGSINAFFAHGPPTFILGTAGDDLADRGVANQVAMIHDLAFPTAPVVLDTAVDPAHWPANPVVYGGPHVNALVASVSLPFTLAPGHLEIGGQTFAGDEHQLIAVVPADRQHPEFLLYAGTGTPGISEINSHSGGPTQIVIKDRFGILETGAWKDGRAVLDAPSRRIAWRGVERGDVSLRFPDSLAASPDEPAQIDAAMRGLATAGAAIGDLAPPRLAVYVYPDRRSKQTLTGDGGDGHAVAEASALHVLAVAPRDLEYLVAHEGTHVRAYHAWGPAGTPLVGEGLAVWAAGFYARRSLADWAHELHDPPSIALLLAGFRKLPEPVAYTTGGLLVEVAVELVGRDAVRTHLYPATAATWAEACRAAGTTPEALQAALDARLAGAR